MILTEIEHKKIFSLKALRTGLTCLYNSANGISECETSCNTQCQRITYIADSDYGYSCNTTRSATISNLTSSK